MSLLSKKVSGRVACGRYEVALISAVEVPSRIIINEETQEQIETKEYIQLEVAIEGYANQVFRLYETQYNINMRELINEYFTGQEMNILEVIEALNGRKIPMTIYKNDKFTNYSFNPKFVVRVNTENELK